MRLRVPHCNGVADVPDEAAPRYVARGFVPVDEPKPKQATKRRTTKRRPKASE